MDEPCTAEESTRKSTAQNSTAVCDTSIDVEKRIETRISLVLYGGVSLAVYMSGACQELLSVVRASSPDIEDLSPVEQEYRKLLRLGGSDGRPRRVVVDVLAGSSAGGLNALFLAKALAHGGSLDSLRRVWHEQADLLSLMALDEVDLDGQTPENGAATERGSTNTDDDFRPALLDGRKFHDIIHGALTDLSNQGASDGSHRLVDDVDCFVTTTDLRGVAETVRLDTTGAMRIQELRRRGVFHFTDRRSQKFAPETKTQLDADHDAILAFAGRSTAAHPAAFYPAQWNRVEGQRPDAANRAPQLEDFLSPRLHPEGGLLDLQDRWYSDGGAMDNKPFKYALEPLRNRRAEVPVDRKVIFVEPAPVSDLGDWHKTKPPQLWNYTAGTYGLARAENIREDIAALAARNESIASLNSALVGLFERKPEEVRAALLNRLSDSHRDLTDREIVASVLGDHYDGAATDAEGGVVNDWLRQSRTDFGAERGWGAVALEDYRWRAMVSHLVQSALTVGESPADQSLVAILAGPVEERLREWVSENRCGTDLGCDDEELPNPVRIGLKLLDVDYRLRRFTLIEHLLSYVQQQILDSETRSGAGGEAAETAEIVNARFGQCVRLRRAINELYADLNNYVEDRRSELIIDHRNMSDEDLLEFVASDEMFKQIEKAVDDLDDPLRRASRDGRAAILDPCIGLDDDLLVLAADAWVNYNDYDQLILPLAEIAANKFGTVDAVRISPLDASGLVDELGRGQVRSKLGGNVMANFGGFIDADWRLNDITWGRFDTAEVLVRQVLHGDENHVASVHNAMLSELVAELIPGRDQSGSGGEQSPLHALLRVNANNNSALHRQAETALAELQACPAGDERIEAAAERAVEAFGLLLRGRGSQTDPDQPEKDPADLPWTVDLSATDGRKRAKKKVLNQGAAILGQAVAKSGERKRPVRVVAGWLLSGSLRLALPRTMPEKLWRHGLPVVLTTLGFALLILSLVGNLGAAALTVGALGASAYALYARARAFGARYAGSLWRKGGNLSFAAAFAAMAFALWLGAGLAGLAALAVAMGAVGVVMWLSLASLERFIQHVGHPAADRQPAGTASAASN